MRRFIGYSMITAPFIAMFVLSALSIGLWQTLAVFAGCAVFIVWISKAVDLIT